MEGFSNQARNYLYPEEAVYLVERYLLLINRGNEYIDYDILFENMLDYVPLPCYLAYVKLKMLDYIVFRHRKKLCCISGDEDIYNLLKDNPTETLLQCITSFDIYPHDSNFSKRNRCEGKPLAHVIVSNSDSIPRARIMVCKYSSPRSLILCSTSSSFS